MTALRIPWFDLGAQLESLSTEIDNAVARVMASHRFVLGPELLAFEEEFASHCGVAHAVGVGSGSDAIELALRAVGVGPGDEVITVSHTFIATALAISATGARPVFVDVREADGLMDPALLSEAITSRTRAILPVHLYGRCADMAPILQLARIHDLQVVEDAAQAHGATYRGRHAGTLGHAGCFSFYPSKNLGALGDGGAVVTSDPTVAERLRLLRNYGETEKYHHATAGRNSRLDELQAAILRAKLPYLDSWIEARRQLARRYNDALSDGPARPLSFDEERDAVHLAVIAAPRRDALQAHLLREGIGTQIHYPVPCHLQSVYEALDQPMPLPVTERLAGEVLSLPMYPELEMADVDAVCDAVMHWGQADPRASR